MLDLDFLKSKCAFIMILQKVEVESKKTILVSVINSYLK